MLLRIGLRLEQRRHADHDRGEEPTRERAQAERPHQNRFAHDPSRRASPHSTDDSGPDQRFPWSPRRESNPCPSHYELARTNIGERRRRGSPGQRVERVTANIPGRRRTRDERAMESTAGSARHGHDGLDRVPYEVPHIGPSAARCERRPLFVEASPTGTSGKRVTPLLPFSVYRGALCRAAYTENARHPGMPVPS